MVFTWTTTHFEKKLLWLRLRSTQNYRYKYLIDSRTVLSLSKAYCCCMLFSSISLGIKTPQPWTVSNLKDRFIYFYFMSMGVLPTFVWAPCASQMPTKSRRGCCIPWNWSYRWLWVILWVLGIKLVSLSRATSALPYTCMYIHAYMHAYIHT